MDLRFGSLQPTNCCFKSLKGKASIFKACKQALFSRLQSLTDLFRPFSYWQKKKHELVEEHDACLLLKSYNIVGNVRFILFIVEMHNLSPNSSGQIRRS